MAASADQSAHVESLRSHGLKATPQRLMVVSVLTANPRHYTATQVSEEAQKLYPFMDLSTVYRNLNALAEAGLVTRTDIGVGEAVYEWASTSRSHHHTICRRCNAVDELASDLLDGLAARLHEERGFRAELGHFAIFGTCRECAERCAPEVGD